MEDDDTPRTGHGQDMAARRDAVLAILDRITQLERDIRRRQAEQVREVSEFIAARERLDSDLGVSSVPGQYRSMVAEVAIAKGVSVITAQSFMSDAYQLVTTHPAVLAALTAGRLGLSAARSVVAETAHIEDDSLRRLADEVIAEEAVDLLPGKVRLMAERRVMEIDPDAASRRSSQERADKHLRLVPAGADTAFLEAYLPVEQAVSCMRSLHDHAASKRAAGDGRSMSSLMCDTFVERLTGAVCVDQVKADVCLVMSDTTLLGLDNKPAQLVGAGPITAALARELATTGRAWLRRLYTDPVDGSVTQMDSRRRLIDGGLRRAVVTADQHCRGIQCASPIRDIDHVLEYRRGGRTNFHNSQGLSKGCHATRDHPGMLVVSYPDSRMTTWTTPSGLVHTSIPPPALGPGSLSRRQVRLRHWLIRPPPSSAERHLISLMVQAQRRSPTSTPAACAVDRPVEP